MRYTVRNFYVPEWDVLEPRVVDLDSKDAAIPAGSILMCADGHVAAQIVNAIDDNQVMEAEDFAPLQHSMKFVNEEVAPPCACGAELSRDYFGSIQLRIQGRGWLPPGGDA